ncbi:maker189 [Drosophila busckii]|uniref:Maker189 n=1 Tax=Drosophila busckii TaxID=30019 RepID=A0A0M3QXN5_DROBS|nr:maker189 [Drosophila busckii]
MSSTYKATNERLMIDPYIMFTEISTPKQAPAKVFHDVWVADHPKKVTLISTIVWAIIIGLYCIYQFAF